MAPDAQTSYHQTMDPRKAAEDQPVVRRIVLFAMICLSATACATALLAQSPALPPTYDLVLQNGRVMDPESGLDAVRHVGIKDDRILAVSETPLAGKEVVDATGLVVAPGFIDLHAHGQHLAATRLRAQDGVTASMELESGTYPVAAWYESREGKEPIHYGVAAGFRSARIKTLFQVDAGPWTEPTPEYLAIEDEVRQSVYQSLTPQQIRELIGHLEQGLREGGLGIGVAIEYIPGASRTEVYRIFELAARTDRPVYVHTRFGAIQEPRTGIGGMQEMIANAAATGAALHLVHIHSMAIHDTSTVLEMVAGARRSGLDITTEVYPYAAWSTGLETAVFDDGWKEEFGISYEDLQWPATGERLTAETFEKYRKIGGSVIAYAIPEDATDAAVSDPTVIIASDGGVYEGGKGHPRGAGTFARTLGLYAREKGALTLMSALRKMTLLPAQRLESFTEQMRRKGRVQVGMDADLTLFDPETVRDRATFADSMRPSAGIAHVLVAGVFVVRDGELTDALPGRAIRADPLP